jgi:tetrapyrrole methylase family protein/MazG family protein
LKPYLIEEAYEVLEIIDQQNPARLREELGDLLLQVIFHAHIAAEQGAFTIDDVLVTLAEKLVRRHPHVFGSPDQKEEIRDSEDVKVRWEQIKRDERKESGQTGSALDGVPKTLPSLLRAYQVQARAARVGFDWSHRESVIHKLEEELQELREAINAETSADPSTFGEKAKDGIERHNHVEAELGDVLFTLVNLARFLKVNPEEALRKTIHRFTERFHFMEARAAASSRALEELSLDEMDALWDKAKRGSRPGGEERRG